MDAPLNQEAANADLISDIVVPTGREPSGVAGLARDLTSETPAWREAWSVGTSEGSTAEEPRRLSYEEDAELRRLNYLAEIGSLAGSKADRLIELRLRDRRNDVRAPREVADEKVDPDTKQKWYQFRDQ